MVSPNNSPVKRKKLTDKQKKFVKAKLEGKTGTQAAVEAYGVSPRVASVMSAENLAKPSIQQALESVYERRGLTLDKIVEPFAIALDANKVVPIEGDFYETDVPDHQIRMTAGKALAQFIGVGKEIAVSGGIHFHQHTAKKKAQYDD